MLTLNKNIKLILNYVVGPLVFCLLAYSIYDQIQRQPNWEASLIAIANAFDSSALWKLFIVVLLMVLNWGIEARKWQVAMKPLSPLPFRQSFMAIFTGTTMAFFTPNRMGEYFGRMLYLRQGLRLQSISVTIACSMAQLLVTVLMGLIGIKYLGAAHTSSSASDALVTWLNVVFYAIVAFAVVLAFFFLRLSFFVKVIERVGFLHRLTPYVHVLQSFNATILLRLLSLSTGRYLVFIIQYYLLFEVFSVELGWWECFWSMSVVFLVLAIVPSIALLTELGIRWKASIELIAMFSVNTMGILATSLTVWVINLVIPALIGSLLILSLRFFKAADRPGRKISLKRYYKNEVT